MQWKDYLEKYKP